MQDSPPSEGHRTEGREEAQGVLERLVSWFDSRLGLSYSLLRPAPSYSINPFYWLGALAVVAFVIQGITGVIMMLYYVPNPTLAYPTTQYIFQNVSYGTFLETVHLYTAYAMIMLTFMHLMRGYFVSVHKGPREVMWLVGMLMGFVTLGFGFTGYLLPWSIVSKSATDVGTGMVQALPGQVSSFLTFLIAGASGDAGELLRFYDLHVVVLPAVLLVLLAVKMYMLETHGVAEPVTGSLSGPRPTWKTVPILPDVTFYLLELAAIFGSAILIISLVFPISLPPEYSAALAGQYTAQPDWYFLWIYQIIKISAFEEAGLPAALSAVTIIFLAIFLLPFLDRGSTRALAKRMKYITLGGIFVAEVAVLTVWGYLTPGQAIPNEQAALVLGGVALAVAIVSAGVHRLVFGSIDRMSGGSRAPVARAGAAPHRRPGRASPLFTMTCFIALLLGGTLSIGKALDSVAGMATAGVGQEWLLSLTISLAGVSFFVAGTAYLLYRLDLPNGRIKRRVRAFELGWGT